MATSSSRQFLHKQEPMGWLFWLVVALTFTGIWLQFVKAAVNVKNERPPELRYGLPSSDYIARNGFIAARAYHTCPWVLEYRTHEHYTNGKASRDGHSFHIDHSQPKSYHWSPSVYANSGYDIGHYCPAEDCTFSVRAMSDSFTITQTMPQTPELNRGPLRSVEEEIAGLCKQPAAEGWIVTLPLWLPDEDGVIAFKRLGPIDIPTHVGKALLLKLPGGRFAMKAWILPNSNSPPAADKCQVVVDEIERAAALELFDELPEPLQSELESGK